jgi:PAS domain S-box-containing protein
MADKTSLKDGRQHRVNEQDLTGELQRSEAQYRSTIDAITDALHVVDRDLRIILLNRAFLDWHRRLGLPVDVVGKALGEIYDFLPASLEYEYRKVFETGEILITNETVIVRGNEIMTETRKIPVLEGRRVVRVITIVRDITERSSMERALRQSEYRYRFRFENSPTALWEEDFSGIRRRIDKILASGVDDFGTYLEEHPEEVSACADAIRILCANRAAMDMCGVPNLEEFNRAIASSAKASPTVAFRKLLTLAAAGEEEFEIDCEIRVKDYERRFIRINWTLAPDSVQDIERVLVSVVDLTERKEVEEVARRAETKLRLYSEGLKEILADRTKRIRELERQRTESEKIAATGRMAARVAHEINNPLAGIKSSLLLLRKIMDHSHPHFRYADRVQNEIDRIARIVRQMYNLYSPDTKKTTKVYLNETIHDVTGIMESTFRAAGIDAVLKLPDSSVEVDLPVGYFDQVLFNLIQNAVDASAAGDTVTISAATCENKVVVEVSDLGSGIPDELRERVFEPFFTTKGETGGKGLGLGLAVSKGMVEAMGGSLTLRDNSPGGTVFSVTLPLREKTKED